MRISKPSWICTVITATFLCSCSSDPEKAGPDVGPDLVVDMVESSDADMTPEEPVCEPVGCSTLVWSFTPPHLRVTGIKTSDLRVLARLEEDSSLGTLTQSSLLTSTSEGPDHVLTFPAEDYDGPDWTRMTVIDVKATQCDGIEYDLDSLFYYEYETNTKTIECGRIR